MSPYRIPNYGQNDFQADDIGPMSFNFSIHVSLFMALFCVSSSSHHFGAIIIGVLSLEFEFIRVENII